MLYLFHCQKCTKIYSSVELYVLFYRFKDIDNYPANFTVSPSVHGLSNFLRLC